MTRRTNTQVDRRLHPFLVVAFLKILLVIFASPSFELSAAPYRSSSSMVRSFIMTSSSSSLWWTVASSFVFRANHQSRRGNLLSSLSPSSLPSSREACHPVRRNHVSWLYHGNTDVPMTSSFVSTVNGPNENTLDVRRRRNVHTSLSIPSSRNIMTSSTCLFLQHIDDDHDDDDENDHQRDDVEKNDNDKLDVLYDEIKRLNNNQDLNVNSPKQVSNAIFGTPNRSTTKTVLHQIASSSTPPQSSSSSSSSISSTSLKLINGNGNDCEDDDDFDQLPYEKRRLSQLILEYKQLLQEYRSSTSSGGSSNKAMVNIAVNEEMENRIAQQQQQQQQQQQMPISTLSSSIRQVKSYEQQNFETQETRRRRRLRPRHRNQSDQQVSHEQVVERLFNVPDSKIDGYWRGPLSQLSRPTARELLAQLDPQQCPMGFDPDATPVNRLRQQQSAPSTSTMGRKGTFLSFCRLQKELYPQCVILVRCGDFYETYGIDAILLVEHVGLNPMAGKAKAGCPWRNIQATVDGLTQQGFLVAVYEEVSHVETNASNVKGNNKLKTRVLTQIVTPASPTYLYDNWLLAGGGNVGSGDITGHSNSGAGAFDHVSLHGLPPSRPCVGVVRTSAGYNMIEVSLEERSIQYSERLTQEAVACRLAAYPPADPLIYVPSQSEQDKAKVGSSSGTVMPPFLPNIRISRTMKSIADEGNDVSDIIESSIGGYRLRVKVLSPKLLPSVRPGVSEADGHIQSVVDALIQLNERKPDENSNDTDGSRLSSTNHFRRSSRHTTAGDFTVTMTNSHTNALYLETAKQIGLLQDTAGIPSLIYHVLDEAAPIAARRFLQRYLLIPPPPTVAKAMSEVVATLISPDYTSSLPPLTVPNLGKILSLIRAGQAGANVYGELLQSLATTLYVLEENCSRSEVDESTFQRLPVDALLLITQHESGLVAEKDLVIDRCQYAIDAIERVLSTLYHVAESSEDDVERADHEDVISTDQYIPGAFFERNEASWRGRVQPSVAASAYERVDEAARRLCDAVKEDFIVGRDENKSLVVQDVFNNLLALKQKPESGNADKEYFHPRDRNGKVLKNRWTTTHVQDSLSDYVQACEQATEEVSSVLSNLAQTLQDEGHIPALIQSGHFNLILSTAFHHAAKAVKSKWELASTIEYEADISDAEPTVASFVDVFPYWMPKSQAVSNTFDLEGMILLTAPNMSGKSTLMRSTAAAALLNVCGLCAPLNSKSRIPRFDNLFVRGASADVPAEDKSAFGAEMEDIAALFRCCGPRSLVFVDELGRGTSPTDGTRLAGAVLEAMADRGMTGIFATHLHDVIDLPLRRKDRIEAKRMAIIHNDDSTNNYSWTYKVEDGICTDSLALITAERFGLPAEIIQRAEELQEFLSKDGSPVNDQTEKMDETAVNQENEDRSDLRQFSSTPNRRPKPEQTRQFDQAIALATKLTGKSPISIPPRWSPPAYVANRSCLYLLQLAEDPPRYYVGETDSLSQRLKQHRMKGGKKWAQCRAVALLVDNKSQARAIESLLIQELAQSGFLMESLTDGRSIRQYRDD